MPRKRSRNPTPMLPKSAKSGQEFLADIRFLKVLDHYIVIKFLTSRGIYWRSDLGNSNVFSANGQNTWIIATS